jgi:AraC-like DNA-binding protein
MLSDAYRRGFPMHAASLPSRAPGEDPVLAAVGRFAALHGVVVAADTATLTPIWAELRRAGVDHPGLAYAQWADLLALGGMIATVIVNSADVGSALDRLEHLHPLLGREELVVRRGRSSVTVLLRGADGEGSDPDTVDAAFASLARVMDRQAAARPTRVLLRRPAPRDIEPYSAAFGPVAFGQPVDSFAIDTGSLANVMINADPALVALLHPYADRRITYQRMRWSDEVSRILAADPHGIPRLSHVARTLAVSARTLQTRLSAEGRHFGELADAVAKDRALTLLTDPDLAINTIAARTGFATQSAFNRAFRRWTGTTPSRMRTPPDRAPRRP